MLVKLKDVAYLVNDRRERRSDDVNHFVSTENLLSDRRGVSFPASTSPKSKYVHAYTKGDILISNIRPYFKKIWKATFDGTRSADVLCFRSSAKELSQDYLYVLLESESFFNYVTKTAKGTKMPRGDKSAILEFEFNLPSLKIQKEISHQIISIEKKIRLNEQINDNLDELSTVIFDRWIRNSSSDVKCPLDHVAKYTNGLAMQKFRPQNNEIGLPVVKIRELNQGDTDENSDYCTSNIDQSVKVNTGDIIFSWSGTLTLDIWAGGEAGLNQHLFKVTSSKYPYWFVFEWTKYYLKSFQNIAKSKATTMGHIKRSDLHSSLVKIPTHDEMIELNTTLSPMYSQKIAIRHENRVLYQMKQQLLSKYF